MIDQIITGAMLSYIANHPEGIAKILVVLIGWSVFNTIAIFWTGWVIERKLDDLRKRYNEHQHRL